MVILTRIWIVVEAILLLVLIGLMTRAGRAFR